VVTDSVKLRAADAAVCEKLTGLRRWNAAMGALHLVQGAGMLAVASFLFLSAVAHALLASPWPHRWHERSVLRGINPARWIEYSLSSSLMMVVIAMLVGIYDVVSLILIFALNATMILGWPMELHNQTTERTNWTAFGFGCFAGAVPMRCASRGVVRVGR
jgi:heliorhodopsin